MWTGKEFMVYMPLILPIKLAALLPGGTEQSGVEGVELTDEAVAVAGAQIGRAHV